MTQEPAFFGTLGEIVAPGHTAVVVVDMQNDFCSPDGYFGKRSDISMVQEIVPNLERFLAGCREAGLRIAHFAMYYSPQTTSGPMFERRNRVGYTENYLIEGTWGSAICDNLLPQAGEPVFPKYRYDGLTSDAFRSWLKENEIKTLVLTGVATNVCVESTARDAYMSGYYVVMVEDCLAAYSREEHRMALQNTTRFFGNVATSHELLEIWRG